MAKNVKPVAWALIDAIEAYWATNRGWKAAERVMQEVMRPWRMDAGVRPAPRLMYVATEDWYFLSHCLAMARAARAAGFEVHVTTNVTDDADAIRGEGFILHTMGSRRGRSSPLQTMRIMSTLRLVDERFATDLVGQAAVALYQRLLA